MPASRGRLPVCAAPANQVPREADFQRSRRRFLYAAGLSSVAWTVPRLVRGSLMELDRPIKLGLIADLHQDIMHDAPNRLQTFLDTMQAEQADALVQLGDFACPTPENQPVTDAFRTAEPPTLHVLGNHEIDKGHTFDEVARLWNMPGRYYTQSIQGLHLIVLDGNEKPPQHRSGYPAHIGPDQQAWLKTQLHELAGPIIVFCHQPLAGPASIDNSDNVQELLHAAADKIIMTVNGHTHIDYLVRTGQLMHLHVNSASYFWVGGNHRHMSYPPHIHASHRWIEYTCPYAEPIFTLLTLDPQTGRVHVQGRATNWVGKSPAELGADAYRELVDGEQICPRIRPRSLQRPPL